MSENLNLATDPVMLDQTGQRIADSLEGRRKPERIITLNEVPIADKAVEAIGIPKYVDDISEYEAYGLTETGWYLFVRIFAKEGVKVSGNYSVVGAAGCVAAVGENYIDVAIQFDVASLSKLVTVNWGLESETFVFKATDLAIRNLDYRSTFYVYDIAPYATWKYAPTVDTAVDAKKGYFTEEDGEYIKEDLEAGSAILPPWYTHSYTLTEDETFVEGKTYYTESEGVYTPATVTAGEAVTPDTYYVDTYTLVNNVEVERGVTYYTKNGTAYVPVDLVFIGDSIPAETYYEHNYALTADETFVEGKTYYTLTEGAFVPATVTAGEAVTPNTYYEDVYALTTDTAFLIDNVYYILSGTAYVAVKTVVLGANVPTVYFNHSKLTLEGMARNITYRLDEPVDCPTTIILPEIEEDNHGAWIEIQFRHNGSYSSTLVPPEGVKVATEHTQAETEGMNMVDLHYLDVGNMKIWRFMNTHATIPTT